jgi:ornithine cyclodeaminase/alanine dehydrogenase-like protein (mu-crystallin family)
MPSHQNPQSSSRKAGDCPAWRRLTKSQDQENIIINRPGRSTYPQEKSVQTSAATPIAAVGSDSPDKQEIEPALLAQSSVVPDLLNHAAHVGDLHQAIAAGLMQTGQIRGELGAVIAGLAPRRTDDDEVIIFDSTGTALQDAAAVATVYEQALNLGRGQSFAFWD